ncbi:DNA polymerase III, subunit gamma and tau [compost metagenome]
MQYSPTRGRYKVYLIDEVHMLSTHSFNALLKTLEEPPPHVKFLLATTDPQKLPVTILSRCLQFSLKNMPPERVVEHLSHVLNAENVPFEEDALWLLGRAADGSMRDAMSLTDQAIAFGEGKVLSADVRAMLGTLDHGQVYGVLHALLDGDARALLEAVRHLAEQGPDWNGVLSEMLNVLHRVAIAQALPDAVDNGQGDRDKVLALAQALPAEDVQFYYQMGLIGRRDLPLAPDPRSGFEMVLLRMLAFRPADSGGAPRSPLKDLGISTATADPSTRPVAGASMAAPVIAPSTASIPVVTTVPAAVAPAPLQPEPVAAPAPAPAPAPVAEAPVVEVAPVTPVAEPVQPAAAPVEEIVDLPWEEPVASKPIADAPPVEPVIEQAVVADLAEDDEPDDEPPPAEDYYEVDMDSLVYLDGQASGAQAEPEPEPAATPATGLAAEWLDLFPRLGLAGMTASIAANCTLIAVQDDVWHLHLDPAQSALFNANQQRRLNDALNQYHGRTLKVEVTLQKPEQETPAQAAARKRAERQRSAEASIEADPYVQQMKQQFAAVVRDGTIEPVEAKA